MPNAFWMHLALFATKIRPPTVGGELFQSSAKFSSEAKPFSGQRRLAFWNSKTGSGVSRGLAPGLDHDEEVAGRLSGRGVQDW